MRVTAIGLLVLGIIGLLVLPGAADDRPATGKPAAKPHLVEVDVSKLPPGLARQVLAAAQGAPARAISLGEALAIAEKLGNGAAIKAERKDDPEVHFKVEVVGKDGEKVKIELNAQGKPLVGPEEGPAKTRAKEPPGKAKKGKAE